MFVILISNKNWKIYYENIRYKFLNNIYKENNQCLSLNNYINWLMFFEKYIKTIL